MRVPRPTLLLTALLLCVPACGGRDGRVIVVGLLTLEGQPYSRQEEQVFVTLIPQEEVREGLPNVYSAGVDPSGRFRLTGHDGGGIPPGTYRVAVSITPLADPNKPIDLEFIHRVNKEYHWQHSPLVEEVRQSPCELTIDLQVRPSERK
jgi:hypothetical protein